MAQLGAARESWVRAHVHLVQLQMLRELEQAWDVQASMRAPVMAVVTALSPVGKVAPQDDGIQGLTASN